MVTMGFLATGQNTYLKTIGTDVSDYGTSCIAMPDLGAVTTTGGGNSTGTGVLFGLVKTDYNGSIEWQKLFENGSFALAKNVVRTPDGGLCVFGEVNQIIASKKALFILKTDSLGNELWSSRVVASTNDRPANLIVCKSGGYLSCSISDYNSSFSPAAQLVRYDENGVILWSKKYRALQGVSPKSVVELPNGDFAFVSSVTASFTGPFQHTLLTRIDAQGNLIWSTLFYGDYEDEPHGLVSTLGGELYVSGASYRMGNEWDGYFLKVNSSGNLIGNIFYDAHSSSGEHFRSIELTSDGEVLLLGDEGGFDERNISLLKVTTSGDILWSRRYPLSSNFTNYGFDLHIAHDQGFVFTGDVRPPGYTRDAALIKTDQEGIISCYVQDLSYTQDNTPFSEMEIQMTQQDNSQITQEAIVFTHPSEQITEKLVCEEQLPIVMMNSAHTTNCPYVCVDFTDSSLNNPTSWLWEFENGDPSFSTEQHPRICYSEPGVYSVKLTASNAFGSVTKLQSINLGDFDCPIPEIPNVFTPNGDGVNDLFEFPAISAETVLYIYNRWGNVVFKGEGLKISWDGKTQQGLAAKEGVYFYKLESKGEVKHGFLQLSR